MKCLSPYILVKSFAPDLKTFHREEKLVVSECLDIRMWKASNSNNVISFNIMSRVCGTIRLYLLKMLFSQKG